MQRLAALLLIVGTAIAWFGESRPIILDVFGGSGDAQAIIDADPAAWALAMAMMALGTLVVAGGYVILARYLRDATTDPRVRRPITIGAALGVASALLYAVARTLAVTSPWEAGSALGPASYFGYALLWQLALIAIGIALLRAAYPRWLAWPVIGGAGLMLIGTLFMPPGVFYFVVMFLGLTLLFARPAQPEVVSGRLEGAGAT